MAFFDLDFETLGLVALVGICWGINTDSMAILEGKEMMGLEVVGVEEVFTSLT